MGARTRWLLGCGLVLGGLAISLGVVQAATGDLRAALTRLAAKAHVKIVMDRAVEGPAPEVPPIGDPLERLEVMARKAGLVVRHAHPLKGPDVVMVVPVDAEGERGTVEVADLAPVGGPEQILVDAMVAAVHPGLVAELSSVGTRAAPQGGSVSRGSDFLDGLGSGLGALVFEGVEPQLAQRLPWGDVGLAEPGRFAVLHRRRAQTPERVAIQVPADARWLSPREGDATRDALLKEALEVTAECAAGGRISLRLRLLRGVSMPLGVDGEPARGGRLETTIDVADGAQLVVTGLGSAAGEMPGTEGHRHENPLDARRPRRLMDRDRHHDHGRADVRDGGPAERVCVLLVRRVRP